MADCPSCHTRLPRQLRAELAVNESLGCPSCQYPLRLKKRPALREAAQVFALILIGALLCDLQWHEAIVLALWGDTLLERYAPWRTVEPAWEQEPWHDPVTESQDS